MRPEEPSSDEKLYECFECGARVERSETQQCDDCGGELRRISTARDL